MPIELGTAKYTLKEAAEASGLEYNTLRSLYQREHFRIIGGEEKKGRGLAALLTLEDVMCIAAAAELIASGIHPARAFVAAMPFAYSGDGRPVAGLFNLRNRGETFLAYWPKAGESGVIAGNDITRDYDLGIRPAAPNYRGGAVILLALRPVEERVLGALGIAERTHDDPRFADDDGSGEFLGD